MRSHWRQPVNFNVCEPPQLIPTWIHNPYLILVACYRRREAERDLGILNSPTCGPPELASGLIGILPKYCAPVIRPRLYPRVCSDRHAATIPRSFQYSRPAPKTVTASGEVRGTRAGWKGAMQMPAKHKGRYFFMERQLQEYTRTIDRLRNLNCVVFSNSERSDGGTGATNDMRMPVTSSQGGSPNDPRTAIPGGDTKFCPATVGHSG